MHVAPKCVAKFNLFISLTTLSPELFLNIGVTPAIVYESWGLHANQPLPHGSCTHLPSPMRPRASRPIIPNDPQLPLRVSQITRERSCF